MHEIEPIILTGILLSIKKNDFQMKNPYITFWEIKKLYEFLFEEIDE